MGPDAIDRPTCWLSRYSTAAFDGWSIFRNEHEAHAHQAMLFPKHRGGVGPSFVLAPGVHWTSVTGSSVPNGRMEQPA